MHNFNLFINGEWSEPASPEWLDTVNPYNGETWAQVPRGTVKDVAKAVSAARSAMTTGPWSQVSASERGAVMRRIGDAILQNSERLAEIEVRENGKLYSETLGQVRASAQCWNYYAGMADKIEGATIPIEKPNTFAYTLREPVGVVAALTAWNSPIWFVAVKCAPALAAGCAAVIKPSEFASAGTLELVALMTEAGLPAGVLNVVTGLGHEAGAALVEHPDVAKITFTGSDATGARIYETAARTMKRVSLELGGKSPNIIFEDANLDLAAVGAVSGIFGASGQMCAAGSRLLVHRSVKDQLVKKLLALASDIKLGDPMSATSNVGPIATRPQFQKVLDYIDVANEDGATCILGGGPVEEGELADGQFVRPTIFTDVTNDMRIAQEEVFGPILSIIEFDTEEEAVRVANDIQFGLVAGVWTSNMARALRMTKALHTGTVWVNTYRTYSYALPFGGVKSSGLGRENGVTAVDEYLETKSVVLSLDESAPVNPFVIR